MSSSYGEDERAMKDIVKQYLESMTPEQNVKRFAYYKTGKTSQLVMKNNPSKKSMDLKKSLFVY